MQDNQDRQLNCDEQRQWRGDNKARHCEIKEQTLPPSGRNTVDGGQNGGVSVTRMAP